MVKILAVNCGSSTLKFKLFRMPQEEIIASGVVDRVGLGDSSFKIKIKDDNSEKIIKQNVQNHSEAVSLLLKELIDCDIIKSLEELSGVGHRVVAGGEIFDKSTLIDQEVIDNIKDLSIYAPLHNLSEAIGMEAFEEQVPSVPQVAVFDTSLYTNIPEINYLYSIPMKYYHELGARKYGAHGTSHYYVTHKAAKYLNESLNHLNIISLHLGSGASITATMHGKVIDTSMGFTPMAGITMSTRSGDIDASLVLFLMKQLNITDPDEMVKILNSESGLLGISELSPDMRDLENNIKTNKLAKLAIDIFVNRIIKYIGSYVAEMGSVDALIFTAGIGENNSFVRGKILNKLSSFLDLKIDNKNNNEIIGREGLISTEDSKVKALVIPTDEELIIARDTYSIGHLKDS